MKLKFIEMMPKEGIVCDERLAPFKHGDFTCFQFRSQGQLYLAIGLPLDRSSDWFAVFRNETGKRIFNEDVAGFAQTIIDVYCAGRKVEDGKDDRDDIRWECFSIAGYDRTWAYAVVKSNCRHMAVLLRGADDSEVKGCEKPIRNDLKSEYLAMKFAYETFIGRWPGREYRNNELQALAEEFRVICPEAQIRENVSVGDSVGFTMRMNRTWFFSEGKDGKVKVSYEDMFGLAAGEFAVFSVPVISPMAIAALDDQVGYFTRGSRLAHINKLLAAESKSRRFENSCLYIDSED